MKRVAEFIKSIMAGIMVSIGGVAFLSCENRYIGALLFSVGLISIVMLGMNLYTGKIGYVLENDKIFFVDTVLSVVGNAVGCLALGLAKAPIGSVAAICTAKLAKAPLAAFIDAILCGILIYVCVDIFKKKNTVIGIVFCIPTFILCGFEHSIADMFYLFNARIFSLQAVIFIAIIVAGNAVGGLFLPVLFRFVNKHQ